MKLYQLEYFAEVYRQGSISKAAEKLFVSQPAISFGIKELEDEFKLKLFTRAGNHIERTAAGEYFYGKVEELLSRLQTLKTEMTEMGDNSVLIKVGTPPMIGTLLFPELYRRINERYPKMKLEILEYGSLQAQSLVANGGADVAIAVLDNLENDALESHLLFETELMYCVNGHHPLARQSVISWWQIERQDIVLMKEDAYQNALIKRYIAENGIKPNVMLYSSQLTTIRNFIVYSNAGAFLFKEIAQSDPEIRALHLETPIPIRIGILWRKNSKLYHDVKNFISLVSDYLTEKFSTGE